MQFRHYLQPGFQNLRQIELIEAARIVIDKCLQVKPGESVAIVTDTMQSWRIAEALAMATNLAEAEYVLVCAKPRKSMYGPPEVTNPPAPIGGALRDADAACLIGTTGLIWTDAAQEALKSGTRILSSPGVSEDNFTRCIMINYEEVWETTERVQGFFLKGKQVRLTSPQGSELTFEIGYPPIMENNGVVSKPGEFDLLPTGFASAGIKEGTANGKLVIDGAFSRIGVLREPIYLTVRDGRIVKSEGGFEEREFRALMDIFNDPNMYNLGSFVTGTNPNAKFTGVPNEDERVKGMVCIMFGDNVTTHSGNNPACMYLVSTLTKPKLDIEATTIVGDGQLKA